MNRTRRLSGGVEDGGGGAAIIAEVAEALGLNPTTSGVEDLVAAIGVLRRKAGLPVKGDAPSATGQAAGMQMRAPQRVAGPATPIVLSARERAACEARGIDAASYAAIRDEIRAKSAPRRKGV